MMWPWSYSSDAFEASMKKSSSLSAPMPMTGPVCSHAALDEHDVAVELLAL
jgi:hypothetical protein